MTIAGWFTGAGARRILHVTCALALIALGATRAHASTAYGDLNNFDVFNDTGQSCHGFEIELDDVRSTDITYTFDWNHYGAPTITQDNSDPVHPKVFVRYAAKYAAGNFSAFTAVPAMPPSPTDGHMCTDPSVNFGCEHFGVGYYGTPTLVRYNWLIEDPLAPGNLTHGPAVNVATPTWNYSAPAGQPAQVQAVILAPPPPPAPVYEFGDAQWVKAIVTTSHNNARVELKDLVSDDPNDPQDKNWRNGEPDEVEIEWQILQTEFNNPAGANNDLAGGQEELANGDEVVTRRYEFYKYAGPFDPESHEANCDKYPPITDPANPKYKPECDLSILGDYIGAQMAGFNVEAVLGLIDHVQDGDLDQPYTARTIVVGGNTPYVTQVSAGALPDNLTVDSATGVLSGTPTVAGEFSFTITATDADLAQVSKPYTMRIAGPAASCDGVICSAPDDCHDAGSCDPTTGICSDPPAKPDDTPCDDGNACTEGDACRAGICAPASEVTCLASDQCHEAGTCDPFTGLCSDPPAPDGTACDDGDGCPADSCHSGLCQAASCPNADAVVLPHNPLTVIIGKGKAAVTRSVSITVRNADTVDRVIALTVDGSACPTGMAASPDFVPSTPAADNSILVRPGKTKTAKLLLTINSSDFDSFNFKAPARCTLRLIAAAVVSGGSNDPNPSNNLALIDVNVVDKNDAESTTATMHETVLRSARPQRLTIVAGKTTTAKALVPVIINADYKPTAEKPGDAITLSAITSCPGLSLGVPVCDPKSHSATAAVKGGASKMCTVALLADSSLISTPNRQSPLRCTVTLSATGPSDPQVAPLDGSNNSTAVVIDLVDRND